MTQNREAKLTQAKKHLEFAKGQVACYKTHLEAAEDMKKHFETKVKLLQEEEKE